MERSYYAVIPADVRYDKELTPNAKLLYGEITALCNEKGYCWASDSYFMELYGVGRSTIQRWIKQLEDKGYIYRKTKYKEGTKQIEGRYIYLRDTLCPKMRYPIPKNETPYTQNWDNPMPKNETENNTVSNNTFNNNNIEYIESTSSEDEKSSSKEDVPYKEIVKAYNEICKSLPSVRVISDKRKKKMRAIYRKVGDLDVIIEAFKKAESSDFLSGRSGKWNGCNFDWLINYNNFIKVIEGTYDNRNDSNGSSYYDKNNKYGW